MTKKERKVHVIYNIMKYSLAYVLGGHHHGHSHDDHDHDHDHESGQVEQGEHQPHKVSRWKVK
jgi:hypothetical protein